MADAVVLKPLVEKLSLMAYGIPNKGYLLKAFLSLAINLSASFACSIAFSLKVR